MPIDYTSITEVQQEFVTQLSTADIPSMGKVITWTSRMIDQISFDRAQLGRTDAEAVAASQLRSAGIDANSPRLDTLRVLKMLLIHDIVEIDAGDTFAYDTARMADQHEREARAADRIFGLLPGDQAAEFRDLWDEFEARQTAEAKFAAAVDRFQPMLQNCLTEGTAWRQHGVTSDRVIARNRHIADGTTAIWDHAAQMIADAVAAGHLAK